jgi:hypothetical protein
VRRIGKSSVSVLLYTNIVGSDGSSAPVPGRVLTFAAKVGVAAGQ